MAIMLLMGGRRDRPLKDRIDIMKKTATSQKEENPRIWKR